jgi:hypothetical protein
VRARPQPRNPDQEAKLSAPRDPPAKTTRAWRSHRRHRPLTELLARAPTLIEGAQVVNEGAELSGLDPASDPAGAASALGCAERRRPTALPSPRTSLLPLRRAKRSSQLLAASIPRVTSNGEVEGPHDHVGRATRAHTVFQRPRSQTDHASRTPPTIVRAHAC